MGLLFLVPLVIFAPSLQFNVGGDYKSYLSILEMQDLSYWRVKNEWVFIGIVRFIQLMDLNGQYLFLIYGTIHALLLVNFTRLLSKKGYDLLLIWFLIIVSSGVLFNSMNGLRHYVAVLAFGNALLYKFDRNHILTIGFCVFGLLNHLTFIFMVAFIILPLSFYDFLFRYYKQFFLLLSFLFLSKLFLQPITFMSDLLTPSYTIWLTERLIKTNYINIITKLYYFWPLLIFLLTSKKIGISETFDRRLFAFGIVSVSVFFAQVHVHAMVRLTQYLALFSLIPIYFLIKALRPKILQVSLVMYLTLSYVFKVFILPANEYKYASIIFN